MNGNAKLNVKIHEITLYISSGSLRLSLLGILEEDKFSFGWESCLLFPCMIYLLIYRALKDY